MGCRCPQRIPRNSRCVWEWEQVSGISTYRPCRPEAPSGIWFEVTVCLFGAICTLSICAGSMRKMSLPHSIMLMGVPQRSIFYPIPICRWRIALSVSGKCVCGIPHQKHTQFIGSSDSSAGRSPSLTRALPSYIYIWRAQQQYDHYLMGASRWMPPNTICFITYCLEQFDRIVGTSAEIRADWCSLLRSRNFVVSCCPVRSISVILKGRVRDEKRLCFFRPITMKKHTHRIANISIYIYTWCWNQFRVFGTI